MPRRTNQFQEIIYLVQSILAPGARVVHSEELTDLVTGTKREVDVCVHSEVAGHPVVVSIECRDHKRPQEVGWVEQMQAKHARLITNVLVLVSSSGFTRAAAACAGTYGIQLVTPGSVGPAFAAAVAETLSQLTFDAFYLSIERMVASVTPHTSGPERQFTLLRNNALYTSDGALLCAAWDLGTALIHNLSSRQTAEFFEGKRVEDPHYVLSLELGESSHELYLQRLSPPAFLRVTQLDITGPVSYETAEMPMSPRQIGGKHYAVGSARSAMHELTLVAQEGSGPNNARLFARLLPGTSVRPVTQIP